jgi:hypothetical protein
LKSSPLSKVTVDTSLSENIAATVLLEWKTPSITKLKWLPLGNRSENHCQTQRRVSLCIVEAQVREIHHGHGVTATRFPLGSAVCIPVPYIDLSDIQATNAA